MREAIRRAARRWGQVLILRTPQGPQAIRGFLQPMPERGETAAEAVSTIGWVDGRLWQYIGPEAVREGDILEGCGLRLQVKSSRAYYLGQRVYYWWAVLEQEKEAVE